MEICSRCSGRAKSKNKVEACVGFEPTNNGFADRPLRPLGQHAIK